MVMILWAYFKDTLPRTCYNGFDNFILNRKPRNEDGEHVRSLESFILALSDQQLVSGLALVISINIIRQGVQDLDTKISAYAYGNAVILAFFSCVIHLATIAVLCDYLKDRHYLKHLRIAVMIVVVALLLQGLAETWTLSQTMTLRCAIANYSFLVYSPEKGEMEAKIGEPATVFGFVVLLGLLISGYVRRIRQLYVNTPRAFPGYWEVTILANTIGWPTSSTADILEARRRLASKLPGQNLGFSGFCHLIFLVIPESFNRSFMYEVVWLIFYFSFGISQLAYYLQVLDGSEKIPPISFEPRFGQLLPLILIVLPFLAMAEGYSGKAPGPNPNIIYVWIKIILLSCF